MTEKLGILDWGIGGFGLYRELKDREPELSITYLSDSGFEPYGLVNHERLRKRVISCIGLLQSKGCSMVVIACNSAGTSVIDLEHPNIVRTGIEMLQSSQAESIGVIGGAGTIASGVFEDISGKTIITRVAQQLSAHIEAGNQHSEAAKTDLEQILAPLLGVEALLLACTHYPAMVPEIREFMGENVQIMDPGVVMANQLLSKHDFQKGDDEIFTTGDVVRSGIAANLAFGVELEEIKSI